MYHINVIFFKKKCKISINEFELNVFVFSKLRYMNFHIINIIVT